jgi:integrase/recombinase XerC/integrase/recombinase XerD
MNKRSIEFINKDELIEIEDDTNQIQLSVHRSSDRMSYLIQAFISAQVVKQSSKSTYHRTLRQYFAWIDHKGYDLTQVARPQIIEYKTDLLDSALSALTVGSYIISVRRFYEWFESEKIYFNVAKSVHIFKPDTPFAII